MEKGMTEQVSPENIFFENARKFHENYPLFLEFTNMVYMIYNHLF